LRSPRSPLRGPPLKPPSHVAALRGEAVGLLSQGGHSHIARWVFAAPLKPPSHVAALRAPPWAY